MSRRRQLEYESKVTGAITRYAIEVIAGARFALPLMARLAFWIAGIAASNEPVDVRILAISWI